MGIDRAQNIAVVAVPVPIMQNFDYRLPDTPLERPKPGCRVEVPFGRRKLTGVLLKYIDRSHYPETKLKTLIKFIDQQPVLDHQLLCLGEQVSRYYHHPLGEVLATFLPGALAQGTALSTADQPQWQLTPQGLIADEQDLSQAPKQLALLRYLRELSEPCDADQLSKNFSHWRVPIRTLTEKNLIECIPLPNASKPICHPGLPLNKAQAAAVHSVLSQSGFRAYLLDGVTGSGKTEVYLQLVANVLERGLQALILVPEIGLTPQLLQRFTDRFTATIVVFHSAMTPLERLRAWRLAQMGVAHIVIGTRSALFTALPKLGLIVVDEEHDSSFKQHEGLRYHARDVALMRAKLAAVPILLGSATPSLETLHNGQQQKYTELCLPRRAGVANLPRIAVIDARIRGQGSPISTILQDAMSRHLARNHQVLIFLNRRGYAPLMLCPACGWHAQCQRCDSNMTLHYQSGLLHCHHCGSERRPERQCPSCGTSELQTQGIGTEKLEAEICRLFPEYKVERIDRDSTRRKGALAQKLDRIHRRQVQILIGTQMIAKGHHFPNVTLVGILDCDRGLFSADFRGGEQMAQLIQQVAGRAGRAEHAGEVLIQSVQPDHPFLHLLVTQGYRAFAKLCLQERYAAALPPYAHLALLRAEASLPQLAIQFLSKVSSTLSVPDSVSCLGPIPAPMEKRAGRYRAQLLMQSKNRAQLHQVLKQLRTIIENSKTARTVRWSLDVDPLHML